MSTSDDGISRDDPRLNEILAEYLQAIEAGHPIDQQRFLQDHPEYAHELQQFFADKKCIDRIAAPGIANDLPASDQPANPIDMPTLPPDTSAGESATLGPLGPVVGREVASQSASPKSGVSASGTLVRYFGDYELLDEIARGGMGVVYKARQVKLNRVVALKMICAPDFAIDRNSWCAEMKRRDGEAQSRKDTRGISR